MAKAKGGGRLVYLDLCKTIAVYVLVGLLVNQLLGDPGLPVNWRYALPLWQAGAFCMLLVAFGLGTALGGGRSKTFMGRVFTILGIFFGALAIDLGASALARGGMPDIERVIDMVTLRGNGGPVLSLMLTTLALLYLLVTVMRPLLLSLARSLPAVVLLSAACLAVGMVLKTPNFPLANLVLGSPDFAGFPLVPYLPWFLFGLHLGQRGNVSNAWLFGIAAVMSGAFALYWHQTGSMPEQFPPHPLWVLMPALALISALYIGQKLIQHVAPPPAMTLPGQMVTLFLVACSLVTFAVAHFFGRMLDSWPLVAGATLAIVVAVSLAVNVVQQRR